MGAKRSGTTRPTSRRGEVLVVVMNRVRDWRIAREELWYRIPVDTAPKRWPPHWLAFYQTKIFREEAFAVRYYGRVINIKRVRRPELFPNEASNPKSGREYFQIFLEPLAKLPNPIRCLRFRPIVFIPTSLHKLFSATEINDLYDDSPLEDLVWSEMKKLEMRAERQFHVKHGQDNYFLDFALFCRNGNLDVETDGDTWHADSERIPLDNLRNNALAGLGWQVLRFNGSQVCEEMAEYCVPQIVRTVNKLGGLSESSGDRRVYHVMDEGIGQQLDLFGNDGPM